MSRDDWIRHEPWRKLHKEGRDMFYPQYTTLCGLRYEPQQDDLVIQNPSVRRCCRSCLYYSGAIRRGEE